MQLVHDTRRPPLAIDRHYGCRGARGGVLRLKERPGVLSWRVRRVRAEAESSSETIGASSRRVARDERSLLGREGARVRSEADRVGGGDARSRHAHERFIYLPHWPGEYRIARATRAGERPPGRRLRPHPRCLSCQARTSPERRTRLMPDRMPRQSCKKQAPTTKNRCGRRKCKMNKRALNDCRINNEKSRLPFAATLHESFSSCPFQKLVCCGPGGAGGGRRCVV